MIINRYDVRQLCPADGFLALWSESVKGDKDHIWLYADPFDFLAVVDVTLNGAPDGTDIFPVLMVPDLGGFEILEPDDPCNYHGVIRSDAPYEDWIRLLSPDDRKRVVPTPSFENYSPDDRKRVYPPRDEDYLESERNKLRDAVLACSHACGAAFAVRIMDNTTGCKRASDIDPGQFTKVIRELHAETLAYRYKDFLNRTESETAAALLAIEACKDFPKQ